jgi:hypothetical protein
MSRIDEQVHGKFKMFAGELDSDGSIGHLAKEAAAWVRGAKVAPKSIGVEYLESEKRVILTVGYRDDEPGYDVKLTSVPIARIGKLDSGDIARLEREMEKACGKLSRIICHELFVTEKGDLSMVFMTHEA